MKAALQILVLFAALYGGLCLLACVFQERLVYFPGGAPEVTPAELGIPFETLELETEDGLRLRAWLLRAEPAESERGAVLFCHGNAGNVAHRLPSARAFLRMGLSVLLFDYRGYGGNPGKPDEEGTYLDAAAAYDHLVGALGRSPERIVLYGESLGGAVALELARRRRAAALIVESAFTSLPDLGAELYPWLPVRLLSRFRYDSRAKIGALGIPVLVAHSPHDEIVPFRHGRALYDAASEPREFLETRGGHNDGGALLRSDLEEKIAAFVERALAEAAR